MNPINQKYCQLLVVLLNLEWRLLLCLCTTPLSSALDKVRFRYNEIGGREVSCSVKFCNLLVLVVR